jgi:HPt (histidine-containing phosphotransfer) domain-containing protein
MKQQTALRQEERIIIHVDREIADLIPGFLENRRKDTESVEEFLKLRNFDSIRLLGHSMKGAGGSYGFDAITDIGRTLEQAALAKDSEEIKRAVQALSAYLDRVEVVYD